MLCVLCFGRVVSKVALSLDAVCVLFGRLVESCVRAARAWLAKFALVRSLVVVVRLVESCVRAARARKRETASGS